MTEAVEVPRSARSTQPRAGKAIREEVDQETLTLSPSKGPIRQGQGGPVSILPTPAGYLHKATLPWPSLVMLMPLILLYEIGTRNLTTAARQGQDQEIIAYSTLLQFFAWFGAQGRHMPGFAVAGLLILWHTMRRDKWSVEFSTLIGMWGESILLGLPLLLVAFIVNRYFPLQAVEPSSHGQVIGASICDRLIMDIGAGVYEEFVFRFLFFTIVSLLLHDILGLSAIKSYLLMVVGSGILFSLYHYWSPTEHFLFRVFAFRTAAGIYFGLIFMFRGFGITSGSHIAYDAIVTLC